MSGLRRSTRATTSTINVKLNEQNEIEYFKVEDDAEDEDDDDIVGDPNAMELDDDEHGDEAEVDEKNDGNDDDEEEEEELVVNPDGTMSIRFPEKKQKKLKVPVHHICAKCSKVLSSGSVSDTNTLNMRVFVSQWFVVNSHVVINTFFVFVLGTEKAFKSV